MWSPNEISKQEKQRDIFAYITLPFFQVKKGSLSTFRFWRGIFESFGYSDTKTWSVEVRLRPGVARV